MPDYEEDDSIQFELDRLREVEEVQVLINKLDFKDPFTAKEFIDYDDESELPNEMISDEEIIRGILPNETEKEENENPLPIVSHNDAIESYDKIISYLEQHEEDFSTGSDEIKLIKRLRKEALKKQFIVAQQTNLDDFVSRSI
jgi:hypothetical protein